MGRKGGRGAENASPVVVFYLFFFWFCFFAVAILVVRSFVLC